MLQQRSLLSSITTINMINNDFLLLSLRILTYTHQADLPKEKYIHYHEEIEINVCRTIQRALENPAVSSESKLTLN